jgi:hypothetical protein
VVHQTIREDHAGRSVFELEESLVQTVKFVSSALKKGNAAGGEYKRGDGKTAAGYRSCPPRPFSSATRSVSQSAIRIRNPQSVSEIRIVFSPGRLQGIFYGRVYSQSVKSVLP